MSGAPRTDVAGKGRFRFSIRWLLQHERKSAIDVAVESKSENRDHYLELLGAADKQQVVRRLTVPNR